MVYMIILSNHENKCYTQTMIEMWMNREQGMAIRMQSTLEIASVHTHTHTPLYRL